MLLYVILAFILMLVDKQTDFFSRFRMICSVPVFSMQYLISEPIHLFMRFRTLWEDKYHLAEQNKNLLEEQLYLRAEVSRLASIEAENRQLHVLLHSSAEVKGKVLIAKLLAVGTDLFRHQITLDRGKIDGLFVGQPVLDGYGVIGQVIRVNPFSSEVLLINDSHSGVPVEVVRSGIRAIVRGDLNGQLKLIDMPQTADVRVDDLLVTSGMGDHYPRGYPVGRVSKIYRAPGLQFSTIIVQPAARIDRSWQVLLVWPNRPMQMDIS